MFYVVDINLEKVPVLDLRRQEQLLVETKQQRLQEGSRWYHLRER
jgi:hypothetical protein